MDDRYEGFNDYDHAYDVQKGLMSHLDIMSAATPVSRANSVISSHRSTGTTANVMLRSSISSRRGVEPSVPMTAVRSAGYSSASRGTSFNPLKMSMAEKAPKISNEEKCRQLEQKVNELLKESIFAWEKGDMKQVICCYCIIIIIIIIIIVIFINIVIITTIIFFIIIL
uniref:ELKS/RAB6-interacting/CAST family member 2 n=1 Tax=Elaeophora elaphi TaxID=1147741 RepID=A0A0R3RLT3_9BILA